MSRSAPTDGSASEQPSQPPPRRRPSRDPDAPRRTFVTHNQHERIQAATAQAIADHGYEATTVQDICEKAQISPETFHEHFLDKQEAAISALEAGVDQVMVELREAFRAAPSWPDAIWDTFEIYLDWMACEPAFARLAVVEMLAAGTPGLELLQSMMDAFGMFLTPGYDLIPEQTTSRSLVDETVANAVFGLLNEHIVREGAETVPTLLPELVRQILTPFLGAKAAGTFVAERVARESA